MKPTVRPSGHVIRNSFDRVGEGAIPGNVVEDAFHEALDFPVPDAMLKFGNNAANDEYATRSKELGLKMHPARFPSALPEFFIKLLTDEGDPLLILLPARTPRGSLLKRSSAAGSRWSKEPSTWRPAKCVLSVHTLRKPQGCKPNFSRTENQGRMTVCFTFCRP